MTGQRVRFRWPDGSLSDGCGVITGTSPVKGYPQWWPLGDFCGYLPAVVAGGDREAQRRQFAEDARGPTIGCQVTWDAVALEDGSLRELPGHLRRSAWVPDARWLATVDGEPLEVPPLVERVQVAGGWL